MLARLVGIGAALSGTEVEEIARHQVRSVLLSFPYPRLNDMPSAHSASGSASFAGSLHVLTVLPAQAGMTARFGTRLQVQWRSRSLAFSLGPAEASRARKRASASLSNRQPLTSTVSGPPLLAATSADAAS